MPKESAHSQSSKSGSRALRRLEPYNTSPASDDDQQHGSHRSSGKESHRSHNSHDRSKSGSHSRSRSPAEPPQWAKVLMRNQEETGKELKRLQGEIERGREASSSKPTNMARVPELSFRYVGNKTQYELNNSVADKIEAALVTNDGEKRTAVLNEGKNLLVERNKHILMAEKFGWDAVECYTAEPLATDADDEKRIRKAVKESKRLREEKKKRFTPSNKARKPVSWTGNSEQKRGLERSSHAPPHGFSAGKPSVTRNSSSVCFRCLRPGHFARDCRAANTRTVTFNGMQSGAVPQQPGGQ